MGRYRKGFVALDARGSGDRVGSRIFASTNQNMILGKPERIVLRINISCISFISSLDYNIEGINEVKKRRE